MESYLRPGEPPARRLPALQHADLAAAAGAPPADAGIGEGGWAGHATPPEQEPQRLAGILLRGAEATSFGVDIHPTFQAALDVAILPRNGISYLACKVTEGTGWYRAAYHAFSQAARAIGLRFCSYHFLRSESTGAAQAAWCRQCMGDDWGRVPVMLDWETSVSGTKAGKSTADAFIVAVRALGGLIELDYIPKWFHAQIGSPNLAAGPTGTLALIQSAYGTNPAGSPANMYPGNNSLRWAGFGGQPASLLQFGSNARLAGYPGPLDINAYRGTPTQLAAENWFHPPAPNPPVAEEDDMTPDQAQTLSQTYKRVAEVYPIKNNTLALLAKMDELKAAVAQDTVVTFSPETITAVTDAITSGVLAKLDVDLDDAVRDQIVAEVANEVAERIANG